jgi:MFS family permease
MNASSNVIFNYIGIFVNLYIWEKDHRIFDVTFFNLILFCSWTLAFALGAKLLAKYTTQLLIRSVAGCGALTFTLLSFLHIDNRLLWITIIAIPIGIMWGFYASTQNISLTVYGRGKDFESYFALSSIVVQGISIANPIIFALVIKWIGYSGSFILMFMFVFLLLFISFRIPKITLKNESEPLFQNMSYQKVFSRKALQWLVPSCLLAGIFLQFQGLFALIFTFSVSEDKLVIALLNVLYAISTIAAMIAYRKWTFSNNKWLLFGMICICIGFLLPLVPKAPILVVSNILTTIGMFYFGTVWNTLHFRIISNENPITQIRILIWREWLLCISRIVMLVIVLSVKELKGPLFIGLIILALICAICIPYLSKKSTDADEKKQSLKAIDSSLNNY